MQPISATDAIGLAFTHTRRVFAPGPFRLGRFFKLALVAAATQATFLSICFGYPAQGAQLAFLSHARHVGQQAFASPGAFAALGVGVALLIIVLILLFTVAYLYLQCRARATLFDLVVLQGGRVREAWRRRARPAARYFGLFLLAMLLFWVAMAAIIGPVIWRFVHQAVANSTQGGAAPAPPVGSILVIAGLIWLLLPVWLVVDALLQDFILPSLALQPAATVADAFARLGSVARRKPGQLLLFLILRTVVAFGVALALGLIVIVALGAVALAAYGVGRLLYNVLWAGSLGAHAVFFAAVAAMALVLIVLYLLAATAVYGVTGVFKTSYAAYFYSSYFPELAVLVGQAPPPPSPPPPLLARADLQPEVW